jgi:hypothetical protein
LPDDELQAAVDSISLFVIAGAHEEELFAGTDRSSGVAQRLEYGLRLMVHGLEHQIQQHTERLQQHSQGS